MKVKTVFKHITIWAAIMCLVAGMMATAYADAGVTYDGKTKDLIFTVDGVQSATDLFGNMFKDMMPGDSATEKITITNNSDKTVRLYMKVDYSGQESATLMKALGVTVTQPSRGTVYESKPGTAFTALDNWVELCTMTQATSTELAITVAAPITMGNMYQEMAGVIVWSFKLEEGSSSTTNTTTTNTPGYPVSGYGGTTTMSGGKGGTQTGDVSQTGWMLMAGGSVIAVVFAVYALIQNKRKGFIK